MVGRALLEPSCVPKALLPGAAWPCPRVMATNALLPTRVSASTGVALPGVVAISQRGAVSVGALGSAGAAQPQLPGSGGAEEILAVQSARARDGHGRALVRSCSCLSLWGDRSCCDPSLAALAAHPSASACSLPPGHRHVAASQRPCLCCEGPASWSLCHGGGLPDKEGEELRPAEPASGRSRHSLLLCLSRLQLLTGTEDKRHRPESCQAGTELVPDSL